MVKADANATCTGCGRPIIWARNGEGKRICLDAIAPVFAVARIEQQAIATRRQDSFVSHFATCPNANQFSKRNGSKS